MNGFELFDLSAASSIDWQSVSVRLALTILHFLWQGVIVGTFLFVILKMTRRAPASNRYLIACVAMASLPIFAAVTFLSVQVPGELRGSVAQTESPPAVAMPVVEDSIAEEADTILEASSVTVGTPAPDGKFATVDPPEIAAQPERTQEHESTSPARMKTLLPVLPWLSALYLLGLVLMSARLLMTVWRGTRLQNSCSLVQEPALLNQVARLTKQIGLKTAPAIRYCERIAVPAVIGIWKPAILLPASLVTHLTPDELAAILNHELAHIRRFDPVAHLIQKVIESILFFHPIVWWISHEISNERENCCDDLAARTDSGKFGYAAALLRIAGLCVRGKSKRFANQVAGLSAVGTRPRQLSRRIERLLDMNSSPLAPTGVLPICLAIFLIGGIVSVAVSANSINDHEETGATTVFAPNGNAIENAMASSQPSHELNVAAMYRDEPEFVLPERGNVISAGFSPDGTSIVTATRESCGGGGIGINVSVRTWEIAKRKLISEIEIDWNDDWNLYSNSLTLSKDQTRLSSILSETQIGIWDTATGSLLRRLELPDELRNDNRYVAMLSNLTCTSDFSRIACGRSVSTGGLSPDAHAVVWDGNSGEVMQVIKLENAIGVSSLSLSDDGRRLATVGHQKGADVWEVSSGNSLLNFRNSNPDRQHPDPDVVHEAIEMVICGGLSPDGTILAISDMLGVKLVDVRSGRVLQNIDAPNRSYSWPKFSFSPDGGLFALTGIFGSEGSPGFVPVRSSQTGQLMAAISPEANCAVFSEDGSLIATGLSADSNALSVWRINETAQPDGSTDENTAPESPDSVSLEDAVYAINESLQEFRFVEQPDPLTVDEIVTWIDDAKLRRGDFDITEDEFHQLLSISETLRLPGDFKWSKRLGLIANDFTKMAGLSVTLQINNEDGTARHSFLIRDF